MLNINQLSKLGIGTWGIGGFAERNPQNDDERQISAISEMLRRGLNYIEVNYWTANGHSMDLVKRSIDKSGISRDKIFISQSIYSNTAHNLEDANVELNYALDLFDTEYIDSLAFNSNLIESIGQEQVFLWFKSLIESKKVRYVNLNNPSLEVLKQACNFFGKNLFSIEVGLNFEIRENCDSGIIDYARSKNVLPVIYQPLRRNRTSKRNWPLLVELTKKYNKTQNQIILNWLVTTKHLPLVKTDSLEHINENMESFGFKLEDSDVRRVDTYRPVNYIKPNVYWGSKGDGVRIDQLSNVFDEEYDKQQNRN